MPKYPRCTRATNRQTASQLREHFSHKCRRFNDLIIISAGARPPVEGPQRPSPRAAPSTKKRYPYSEPLFHYSGQLGKKRFLAGITAVGQVNVISAAGFPDPKPGSVNVFLVEQQVMASNGHALPAPRSHCRLSSGLATEPPHYTGAGSLPCNALLSVTAVALAKLLLTRLIR